VVCPQAGDTLLKFPVGLWVCPEGSRFGIKARDMAFSFAGINFRVVQVLKRKSGCWMHQPPIDGGYLAGHVVAVSSEGEI
jgi:hypothetical protein